jgi:hypothetical protein
MIAIAIARLLTQALSNLVTGHEELMDQLWETYLNLPEDQVVIMYVFFSAIKILFISCPKSQTFVGFS